LTGNKEEKRQIFIQEFGMSQYLVVDGSAGNKFQFVVHLR